MNGRPLHHRESPHLCGDSILSLIFTSFSTSRRPRHSPQRVAVATGAPACCEQYAPVKPFERIPAHI